MRGRNRSKQHNTPEEDCASENQYLFLQVWAGIKDPPPSNVDEESTNNRDCEKE